MILGRSYTLSETSDFVQDHLTHLGHLVDNFEAKVERCGACWLIRGVMPDGEISMLEGIFDGDALGWIKG